MSKAVITCAITGVLTNPAQHPVPVTPEEMANSAKEAFDAGASVMHVHFRMQAPGMGHLPSWQPEVAKDVCDAIRDACPGVIINMTTGVIGNDISGPEACMREVKPRGRGVQRRKPQLPQNTAGWLVGLATDALRQSCS